MKRKALFVQTYQAL